MMRFYYAPGACSLGIHIILEEIGAPYEANAIDLKSGEQLGKAYRSVNPKGKLPALVREDGSLLTEFQAIAFWLAKSHPEAGLIAAGLEGEVRVLEALDFIVGSVHMRGFTLMLVPSKFVVTSGAQEEVRVHGREMAMKGLKQLSEMLGDGEWVLGDYSIVDPAVFYLTQWAIVSGLSMPRNLKAFRQRMLSRGAVRRAMEREGLAA